MAASVCAACAQPIVSGGVITFGDGNTKYHEACFRCGACQIALGVGGRAIHSKNNRPYCAKCWTAKFAERCGKCARPFEGQERIIISPIDGSKLHPECFRCAGPCGQPFPDGKFVKHGDAAYCSACYADAFGPKCSKCRLPIGNGVDAKYVVHRGKKLHRHCFACAACNKTLAGTEHYERDGQLYCAEDYKNAFGAVCALCNARLLTWIACPTGEVYCRKHEGEAPPCHGCGRLVGKGSGGHDLADGRVACKQCASTAVWSLDDAKHWYVRVRKFLTRIGLANLPDADAVKLQLCDRSQLLARNRRHLGPAHHTEKCPVGLTSAEELQTVQYDVVGTTRPVVERHRTIEAVSVLIGLPSELCAVCMPRLSSLRTGALICWLCLDALMAAVNEHALMMAAVP